jgi:hypothetical protein
VYASAKVLRAAEQVLGDGRCLEREVAAAIAAGGASGLGTLVVGLDFSARCIRRPGKLRPNPAAWVVVSVERAR